MKSAGVAILTPDGREVASTSMDLPHGLAEPTGLHHVKGDQSTQVVLFGRVGAKAARARIYSLEGGALRPLFDWSGWSFHIITFRGATLIATRELSHGVVTDLQLWRDNRFVKANELFPEFYAGEIQEQEEFIRGASAPFALYLAEACRIVAQELLYGRRYMEAKEQCQEALVALGSRCSSGASSAPPDVASDDRKRAEQQIKDRIQRIEAAEKRGSTALDR